MDYKKEKGGIVGQIYRELTVFSMKNLTSGYIFDNMHVHAVNTSGIIILF